MFLKLSQTSQGNPCKVCETFKNTYFKEHLQTNAPGGFYKNAVLKNFAICTGQGANDKCSVKKEFLVVDRAVKVTCFILINVSCKNSAATILFIIF